MRWEELDLIREGGEAPKRTELRPGQLVCPALAQQVGPPGASYDQASTAEQRNRTGGRPFEDEIGEMLWRMARGFERDQPQGANLDLVAFVKPAVRELVVAPRWRRDRGPGRRLDRQGSGQVVVVDMGLEDVPDGKPFFLCDLEKAPGVALRIDEQRFGA